MPAAHPSAIESLNRLIAQFHSGKRLRVWSLVITVFGDAVLPRGGMIGMTALQDLTTRMEITPGALRAAMSRLAKDGWLVRFRHGRRSYYRLSEDSAARSLAAGARFYAAATADWDGGWTLALAPEEPAADREMRTADLADAGFLRISNGLYLRPATRADTATPGFANMFVLDARARSVPDWLLGQTADPEVAESYGALIDDFAPLETALASGASLTPLDAMVARTLLIHDWRRTRLRDADLPAGLRPADWPGEAARALAGRLYARLLAPSELWLDACDGRPDGPLPKPGPMLAARFGNTG